MARGMNKITEGRVKDKGKTWFPQLVDKRKSVLFDILYVFTLIIGRSVKIHLYWAMKNCSDSPNKLKELIISPVTTRYICMFTGASITP